MHIYPPCHSILLGLYICSLIATPECSTHDRQTAGRHGDRYQKRKPGQSSTDCNATVIRCVSLMGTDDCSVLKELDACYTSIQRSCKMTRNATQDVIHQRGQMSKVSLKTTPPAQTSKALVKTTPPGETTSSVRVKVTPPGVGEAFRNGVGSNRASPNPSLGANTSIDILVSEWMELLEDRKYVERLWEHCEEELEAGNSSCSQVTRTRLLLHYLLLLILGVYIQ
ncbi:unnamed protein product [Lymnaea stagnalis]|uniref:Uncharacterized protein n=1 Tax=Lymnaea stagnalis TaxID=6523 RepID=A0AAV2HDR9_LYMST